jgi:DNA-binding MarR family transcriptional regulator
MLFRAAMNAVYFGLKRAFQGWLRIGRKEFLSRGLTAARFDLLYAMTVEGKPRETFTFQSTLRRVLGVSRATVSRMLISLEELGLVRRQRSEEDRRQLEVYLTPMGASRIERAFDDIVKGGIALETPNRAFDWEPPSAEETVHWCRFMAQTETFEALLTNVRVPCRDFASLEYRWYDLPD